MRVEGWVDETAQEWAELQQRLQEWLASEPADQYVLLELAWPEDDLEHAAPYVQLTVEDGVVRTEAVSNHHLDPRFRLDEGRVHGLAQLGWEEPDSPGGSRNHWRDYELPEDAGALAELMVATLRDVYGVPAPSFLEASGFDEHGRLDADELPFGLPTAEPSMEPVDVSVVVADDPDELRDHVATTVASVVDHEVEFDEDGDIPVPAGSTLMFVRVAEDSPSVTLFATVLFDVRWTPRVGHTLNEMNKRMRYGRLVFHRGQVLLEHRLFCRPFVPELLRHDVVGMTGFIPQLESDLHDRLGGSLLSDHHDGAV